MVYTVYILYSRAYDRIYIGFTSNLIDRFYSHNELSKKGYTKKYRPWEVVYCEWHESKAMAMKREKQLKGGKGREWIREKLKSEWLISA